MTEPRDWQLVPEWVRARVRELYAELDARIAARNPRCDASGRCCRFAEYEHTLFLSQLEAAVLLESAPAYALPVGREACPFQIDGLCTAREPRPTGCRIYFCDPSYQDEGRALSEEFTDRLKRLADEAGLGWRYAPLHAFLNEAPADRRAPAAAVPTRIPLPLKE